MTSVAGSSKKPKLTKDLEIVDLQLRILRSVRRKPSLTTQENLVIPLIYYSMYREHLSTENKSGPIFAVSRTAALVGDGKGTVCSAEQEWTDDSFLVARI